MLKVMDFSIPEEIAIVQSLKSDYFNGPQFTYQCPYEHLLLINIFRPPVFSI